MLRLLSGRGLPMAVAACAVAAPALYWGGAGAGAGRFTAGAAPASAETEALANTRPQPALVPSEFRGFTLVGVERLTRDTAKYVFALPREGDELGLTVASCLVIKAGVDDAGAWGEGEEEEGVG